MSEPNTLCKNERNPLSDWATSFVSNFSWLLSMIGVEMINNHPAWFWMKNTLFWTLALNTHLSLECRKSSPSYWERYNECVCAMKGLVSCEMEKGIKLGYVESIFKNAKENENYSKNEIELGHSKLKWLIKISQIEVYLKGMKRKMNWVAVEEKNKRKRWLKQVRTHGTYTLVIIIFSSESCLSWKTKFFDSPATLHAKKTLVIFVNHVYIAAGMKIQSQVDNSNGC